MIAAFFATARGQRILGFAAIAGGVVLALWAAYLIGDHRGATRVIERHELAIARAEKAAARITKAALDVADTKRVTDVTETAIYEKELTDAIDKAAQPGAAPGPATLAANCLRLRRAGQTATAGYRAICE